jgi:Tol biopolymer transport system component
VRGPLPLDEALPIAKQIAEAVEAAHEQGIIHRDLKPANIKLRPDGTVKVLDFGLAKLHAESAAAPSAPAASLSPTITSPALMTSAGMLLGTAAYMSPEQARGKPADKRSDIWAFGCVLYEMLTGRRPFDGPEITDVLARVLEREIDLSTLPTQTPSSIRRLIERCLAKDPRNRLPHIGIVRLEVDDARRDEPSATVAADGRLRERIAWVAAALLAVTAASAWGVASFRATAPPAGPLRFAVSLPEPMELQDLLDAAGSPVAFSRDGRRLALIVVDERRERRLVVRPIDVLAGSVLPGTEGARAPFWSPDGDWVAFFAGGKLKKVRATGGPVEVIADSGPGGGGTWNVENTILFSPADAGEGGLVKVAAAGGSPTVVTTLDKARGETNYLWPQFLPDGRHYLFFLGGGAEQGVYVGSLDSRDRTQVMSAASLEGNYTMPLYAAGRLFFVRNRTLFAQPFDPDRFALSGEPTRVAEDLATNGPGSSVLSVTDDALVMQNSVAPATTQLTWVTRNGERLSTVGDPQSAYSLRLSPDERRIGVVRYEPTVRMWPSAIWLTDATRGAASRFSFTWGADNPVWSLDGERIVFARVGELGPPNIVRKAADGRDAEEVLFHGISSTYPTDWSPDSSTVLYAAMDNETRWTSGGWQPIVPRHHPHAYSDRRSTNLTRACHRTASGWPLCPISRAGTRSMSRRSRQAANRSRFR